MPLTSVTKDAATLTLTVVAPTLVAAPQMKSRLFCMVVSPVRRA